MMKYIIAVLFLINGFNLFSQGFDWQWSARLPFESPRNYYGLSVSYGMDHSFGNISFLEDSINCPDFINAGGNNFGFGLNYIQWEKYNRYAIYGSFRYNYFSITASSIDDVPLTNEITARYKTSLNYNFSLVELKAGVNYRILETHLLFGAGINIGFAFDNTFTATEEILGPAEVPPFATNPPSYIREITSGELQTLNKFQIKPHIKLGYNLEVGRGVYVEPNLCLIVPLRSMFDIDKVRNYSILFGLCFYKGI